MTLDEAQHLVDTQGVDAPAEACPETGSREASRTTTQAAITDAAEETIEELVRQIGRTLHFMDAQRRHLHPAAIWLMGGGASMCNIGSVLGAALGCRCTFGRCRPRRGEIAVRVGQRSAVFGGAVALSALAWGRSGVSVSGMLTPTPGMSK